MLPNLDRLSLAPKPPCCAPIGTSLFQMAQGSATCGICLDPLTADSTDNPWTGLPGRTGPFLRVVCENDHVFHAGCAVNIVLTNHDDPLQQICPDCRDPLKPIILQLAADVAVANPPAPARSDSESSESSETAEDQPYEPTSPLWYRREVENFLAERSSSRLDGRVTELLEQFPEAVSDWYRRRPRSEWDVFVRHRYADRMNRTIVEIESLHDRGVLTMRQYTRVDAMRQYRRVVRLLNNLIEQLRDAFEVFASEFLVISATQYGSVSSYMEYNYRYGNLELPDIGMERGTSLYTVYENRVNAILDYVGTDATHGLGANTLRAHVERVLRPGLSQDYPRGGHPDVRFLVELANLPNDQHNSWYAPVRARAVAATATLNILAAVDSIDGYVEPDVAAVFQEALTSTTARYANYDVWEIMAGSTNVREVYYRFTTGGFSGWGGDDRRRNDDDTDDQPSQIPYSERLYVTQADSLGATPSPASSPGGLSDDDMDNPFDAPLAPVPVPQAPPALARARSSSANAELPPARQQRIERSYVRPLRARVKGRRN